MQTIDEVTNPPQVGAGTILRRALIVGGVFSLLPLLFFGFFYLVVVGPMNMAGDGMFAVFIVIAMLMFGAFGAMATLFMHWAYKFAVNRVRNVYEPFARLVGGQLTRPARGLFGMQLEMPTIWFKHGDMPVELRTDVEGSGEHRVVFTALDFTLSEPAPVDLQVWSQGAMQRLSKWLGMQDIELGDPQFDERYIVQASRDAAATMLLTPEVRQALLDLAALRTGVGQYVDMALRGNSLRFRTVGYFGTADELLQFYQHAGRVVDCMLSPNQSAS